MVANRCLAPSSKLTVEAWLGSEVFIPGLPEIPVHPLYRAMDALLAMQDRLEERVFFSTANLLNLEVDIVFLGALCQGRTTSLPQAA
ncbi:hypothetical protein [Caldinitratiruptor microaerophilus]|uniref:Uncharacterized protein n=1 Tax=Caldinitratiruptor microaerophilus TaxID=671077 RepID=A0AA35G5J1_9FIRM|nr:hypothetical protein [Caldinitratiruptor microaerophilus]BDG59506.1 hypothetical protein caldi_05960 [Caldinitratiruptor microaerophilus]